MTAETTLWRLIVDGNLQGACNKLGDFINQVAAQNGKALTSAEAEVLTADAQRIQAVIGCS